jgi:hypothetical protein
MRRAIDLSGIPKTAVETPKTVTKSRPRSRGGMTFMSRQRAARIITQGITYGELERRIAAAIRHETADRQMCGNNVAHLNDTMTKLQALDVLYRGLISLGRPADERVSPQKSSNRLIAENCLRECGDVGEE